VTDYKKRDAEALRRLNEHVLDAHPMRGPDATRISVRDGGEDELVVRETTDPVEPPAVRRPAVRRAQRRS
jgi:hypothetical protein